MICLDTNYLIRALIPETSEARNVEHWIASGETLVLPAVAWYEFLCGSTEEEECLALALVNGGLSPFAEPEARIAADAFKAVKTPCHLRVDAMIAGTAIALGASLATNNRADFEPFLPHGLILL